MAAALPETNWAERFESLLPQLERLTRRLCRRHGLRWQEADDAVSFVWEKLIEDDYRRLRQFRGQGRLVTYLCPVLSNLVRDFRVQRWGRWRPSAQARRAGRTVVQLERLLLRDGLAPLEAVETLRTNLSVSESPETLLAMTQQILARYPRPQRRKTVEVSSAAEQVPMRMPLPPAAMERSRVVRALYRAIGTLEPDHRAFLERVYFEGRRVTDLADQMRTDRRQLYGLQRQLQKRLRAALGPQGFGPECLAVFAD
jgi:RNA polymerase sigma factor (sigma-70 family)